MAYGLLTIGGGVILLPALGQGVVRAELHFRLGWTPNLKPEQNTGEQQKPHCWQGRPPTHQGLNCNCHGPQKAATVKQPPSFVMPSLASSRN